MDGGNRGKGHTRVVALLRKLGIEELSYLVSSHYDADHIGGLDEVYFVLRDLPVAVYDRGTGGHKNPPDTNQYEEYATAVAERRETIVLGRSEIDLGAELSVLVVATNGCVFRRRNPSIRTRIDENAVSVAIVLNYRMFDYFLGGDLTGGGRSGSRVTQDLESLAAPVAGDVDVLRINHHGSQTSSNQTFLQLLSPEIAVISVGNGGSNRSRYLHPRRAVLDRLHDLKEQGGLELVFMTNRGETDGGLLPRDDDLLRIANGDVVIFTDGRSYTINGVTLPTDGLTSRAALAGTLETEECRADD
jgi:beta-lactamase superfamily II metal-dependent hydrolase